MAKVYLFLGVETYNYSYQEFDSVIQFCHAHDIDGILLKVYEFVQGDWYKSLGGSSSVVQHIQDSGLECIPYGFFYGGTHISTELNSLRGYMGMYPRFCLNLESDWDNNNNGSIDLLSSFLVDAPKCEIWVSTWANPIDHNWIGNIQKLDQYVSVWMPEEYNDDLLQRRLAQFPTVRGSISPTYEVGGVTVSNVATTDYPSIWEYQIAVQQTSWVDSFVQQVKGVNKMTLKLDKNGCVVTVTQSNQLMEGEPDLCGPWSAVALDAAVKPGDPLGVDAEYIDSTTDEMVQRLFGELPKDFPGVMPADMERILTDLRDRKHHLHWQEVTKPEQVEAALRAGYPCLFSVNERDILVWDKKANTWAFPYSWHINAGHVMPVIGLDNNGNWIVADQLNNNFQGYWPVIFRRSSLVNSLGWCAIIKLNFLADIPGPDPLQWPAGFNAQTFAQPAPQSTPPPQPTPPQPTGGTTLDGKTQQMQDVWKASPGAETFNSAIYNAWAGMYTTLRLGPPVNAELNTVDWAKNPIVEQDFSGGYHAEYSLIDHKTRIYDMSNKLVKTV